MPRTTVDVSSLLVQLLAARVTGVTVRESVDVSSWSDNNYQPLLTVRGLSGQAIRNGPYTAGWSWLVHCQLLAAGDKADAADLADAAYTAMHQLPDEVPQAGISGQGYVHDVDDVSMFARTATTAVNDEDAHQFDATFQVVVRPN